MVDLLSIGAGATQLYRSALTTVSNNIANMNTDGYTRQVATSEQNTPVLQGGGYIGSGAHLGNITRAFSEFNESNLRNSSSELGTQDPMIKYADRIVDVMGSDTSSLSGAFDQFFSSASSLSSDPASGALRNLFLRDADGLAIRFRELDGQLNNIEKETQSEINLKLTSLNELGKQLYTINQQLAKKTTLGEQPPNLLDERDGILRDMADIAKIYVKQNSAGTVEVRLDNENGTSVVDPLRATVFSATFDAAQPGTVGILANVYGVAGQTNSVTGGSLGGLLNFRSQVLAPTMSGLDALAVMTTTQVNAIQTTGVDANGERGTALYDADVATTGAAGFKLLQTDSSKIAAAGLLQISANAANTGGATLSHTQIAAGTATPNFTLNFTTVGGYAIGGAAVAVDANGVFAYQGISYTVTGTPANGDSFTIGLNTTGSGDNRNMLLMGRLQDKETYADGRSMSEGYLDLVRTVGNTSALAKISQDALQAVRDQAVVEKDKLSGVSLDQEAAELIRFQQAFQASAQIIQTASKMFDSILGIR